MVCTGTSPSWCNPLEAPVWPHQVSYAASILVRLCIGTGLVEKLVNQIAIGRVKFNTVKASFLCILGSLDIVLDGRLNFFQRECFWNFQFHVLVIGRLFDSCSQSLEYWRRTLCSYWSDERKNGLDIPCATTVHRCVRPWR
jgi:hypothetical protein